jgi:hypothetical protein
MKVVRTCTPGDIVSMAGTGDLVPMPSSESASYLQVNPDTSYNGGKWKDNTWYQVVLKTGISAGVGTFISTAGCRQTVWSRLCLLFCVSYSAQDCRMKGVIITPYSYWTSVLEEPIKQRSLSSDSGADSAI